MPVSITGLACATPLGLSPKLLFKNLLDGQTCFRPLTRFDTTDYRHKIGGEIIDLEIPGDKDPAAVFLEHSLKQAIESAGWTSLDNTALILGTNFSFQETLDTVQDSLLAGESFQQGYIRQSNHQASLNRIAEQFGLTGQLRLITLSCSSGGTAIGLGAFLIASGQAEQVICGGFDSIEPYCWSGLTALRTMTTDDTIHPFDLNRNGTLFSEGAGILALESTSSAKNRNVKIRGKILGFGTASDAFHLTQPPPDCRGYIGAIEQAFKNGGVKPEQIDFINCHGTGTKHNDKSETTAFKKIFNKRASKIPICANKGALGHLMGAGGAVEAIVSVLSLEQGILPKTQGFKEADPECDLDYCLDDNKKGDFKIALSTSAGLGGNDSALIIGRGDS